MTQTMLPPTAKAPSSVVGCGRQRGRQAGYHSRGTTIPGFLNLTVLTNGGNLFFSNSTILPLGPFAPSCVVATDINGDGSIDLISANYGDCGEGNTLTVFTNNGKGDFTSNATITVGYGPNLLGRG
jgi:hypothetical protein